MCGISGYLNWNTGSAVNPPQRELIEKMNRCLIHRGPDDEGYFLDQESGGGISTSLAMAMRRLAIIDVAHGHQPMYSENKDVVVVFNGEIYNFQELRSQLVAHRHTFKTNSDTEVLAHGYEVWGEALPSKLNGMFAFAIWDKQRRKLLLARDHMGIKPLYYAVLPNVLVFGSEIKAVMQHPDVPNAIDATAVDDYLSLRYVPTPKSIYQHVRKLEPASMLVWENGTTRQKSFWQINPPDSRPDLGLDTYLEKTDALLNDAVKSQLISEVPLGTFLSGGVDSPTISYYAKKHKPDLMTFNIYFAEKSFSERDEAALVARHLGTRHIEKQVSPNILSIIPNLIDAFDEPFGDDSMIPTYFLTKLAREKMTVALSGDGGDELFGGYPTYLADKIAMRYRQIPNFVTSNIIEPIVRSLPVSHGRISFDYKAKAFVEVAKRASPLEHFGWTEIFRSSVKKQLYSSWFWNEVGNRPLAESFTKAYNETGARKGLERFLYVDQRTHLLDEFLVKVDRLSMAHSLEVRPPFLDRRLVQLASEIPFHYKMKGFTMKYILRRLMKGRLPRRILTGAKKGFAPPMATWLATDLQQWARRKLDPSNLRDNPYLNRNYPMQLLEAHLKRKTNLSRPLWTLLMFVEWYDRKVLKKNG